MINPPAQAFPTPALRKEREGWGTRCDGKVHARETPIGRIPELADLDTTGLDIKGANVEELLRVDIEGWRAEVPLIKEHFAQFGSHLPEGLNAEVKALEDRLQAAKG